MPRCSVGRPHDAPYFLYGTSIWELKEILELTGDGCILWEKPEFAITYGNKWEIDALAGVVHILWELVVFYGN